MRHAQCSFEGDPGNVPDPLARKHEMTSLPNQTSETTLGIVIRTPSATARPVRFWAYLWASDEASEGRPWHERVPVERHATA